MLQSSRNRLDRVGRDCRLIGWEAVQGYAGGLRAARPQVPESMCVFSYTAATTDHGERAAVPVAFPGTPYQVRFTVQASPNGSSAWPWSQKTGVQSAA